MADHEITKDSMLLPFYFVSSIHCSPGLQREAIGNRKLEARGLSIAFWIIDEQDEKRNMFAIYTMRQ